MYQRILNKIPLLDCRAKIEVSISLLCFAMLMWAIRDNEDSKACVYAMAMCTVGDVLLNIKPVEERSHTLLYLGAGAFMVAHLIYGFAFYQLIFANSFRVVNVGFVLAIIIIISATLAILLKIDKEKKPKISMIAVFTVYILVIGFNFTAICSYSWSELSLVAFGALGFLASDLIIGVENLLKVKDANLRKMVWILYPIGQLIILSAR